MSKATEIMNARRALRGLPPISEDEAKRAYARAARTCAESDYDTAGRLSEHGSTRRQMYDEDREEA